MKPDEVILGIVRDQQRQLALLPKALGEIRSKATKLRKLSREIRDKIDPTRRRWDACIKSQARAEVYDQVADELTKLAEKIGGRFKR